ASAAGHSLVAVGRLPRTAPSSLQQISLDDAATAAGACLLGLVWLWLRQGRPLSSAVLRRVVTGVVAGLSIFIVFNLIAIASGREIAAWNPLPLTAERFSAVGMLAGIGACLFAIGTAEALGNASNEFPQPKIRNLRRTARLANGYSLLVTVGVAFLFVAVVLPADRPSWRAAPLASIPWFGGIPHWAGFPLGPAIGGASALFLGLAVHRSAGKAQELLLRLCEDGIVPRAMRALHPRFGTPSRLIDLFAIAQLAIILVTAGQPSWLARAYAIAI